MDESTRRDQVPDLDTPGPLTLEQARLILDRGAERLSAGEFAEAFRNYRRVIGFDDP